MWTCCEIMGRPGASTDGHNEIRALFANGNCAMWVDATSAAGYILDPSQSRVAGTTGFAKAPVPKVPNGAAWAWSWALAIPKSSPPASGRQAVHQVGHQQELRRLR